MRVKSCEEASRYGSRHWGTLLKSWRQRSRDAWFLRCSKKTNSSVLSCGYDEASRRDPDVIQETILETPSGARSRSRKLLKSWILQDQMFSIGSMSSVVSRCSAMCKVVIWQASLATSKWPLQPIEQSLQDLPGEYYLDYSGQFETQQQARLRLWGFAALSMVGVYYCC